MDKPRWSLLVAVLLIVGAIVGIKSLQSQAAVAPMSSPTLAAVDMGTSTGTLLLFNRNMGCVCVLKLYAAADSYFNKMDPELAAAFHARRINADESPDLVEAHKVIVAPTIIVLDPEGNEVLRQESKVKWDVVEAKLREMLAQEGRS